MEMLRQHKVIFWNIILLGVLSCAYFFGMIASKSNNIILAIVLCVIAVAYYIGRVVLTNNIIDFNGVFCAALTFAIGLCALRLSNYQKAWGVVTWLGLWMTVFFFAVGTLGGKCAFPFVMKQCKKIMCSLEKRSIVFQKNQRWVFNSLIIVMAISVMALLYQLSQVNWTFAIFAKDFNEIRMQYLTKMRNITVIYTIVPLLGYWCWKKTELKRWQKIFVGISIVYSFLIPILMMERAQSIYVGVALGGVAYIVNKKYKFLGLFTLAAIVIVSWAGGSMLRSTSSEYLTSVFQIETKPEGDKRPTDLQGDIDNETYRVETNLDNPLAIQALWAYGYFTCSLDNFNKLVEVLETDAIEHTYGMRQLVPVMALLRFSKEFRAQYTSPNIYMVAPGLNTISFPGDAYYDFGLIGIVLLASIWGALLGFIEHYYLLRKSSFASIFYGLSLVTCVLSFFFTWASYLNLWIFWGLTILLFVCCNFHIEKKVKVS